MEKKIPWLKIAVAAAVVATTAVGIALFIKKKIDDLRLKDEEYDLFDDDECEFYDSYNPMDEVMTQEDDDICDYEEEPIEETIDTVEETDEPIENLEEDKEF